MYACTYINIAVARVRPASLLRVGTEGYKRINFGVGAGVPCVVPTLTSELTQQPLTTQCAKAVSNVGTDVHERKMCTSDCTPLRRTFKRRLLTISQRPVRRYGQRANYGVT